MEQFNFSLAYSEQLTGLQEFNSTGIWRQYLKEAKKFISMQTAAENAELAKYNYNIYRYIYNDLTGKYTNI